MRYQQRRSHQRGSRFLLQTIQAGILVAVGLFYFIARDAAILDQLYNKNDFMQRSLLSEETLAAPPVVFQPLVFKAGYSADKTPPQVRAPPPAKASPQELQEFLKQSILTEEAKDYVRNYDTQNTNENQPLRHLRFADLILPEVPPGTPLMTTAHSQSTLVAQAPWFQEEKICNTTCCAQAVAISLKQDETRIINAVDGPDLSELLLYGNTLMPFHKFAAHELTPEVIPCLQPGVVIHADSYRYVSLL